MAKNLENNRRRNQIIADRTGMKITRDRPWAQFSDRMLWEAVEAALNSAVHTQRYMGHVDKTAEAVIGRGAAEELRARGVQTQLPI